MNVLANWITKLSDGARAILVFCIIAIFALSVAIVAFVTNNAVLATIVGVIIGASFAIIGSIVNVTVLDPITRKQDREERLQERAQDREERLQERAQDREERLQERAQDREERLQERERELSHKNAYLRRALYGEMISLASNLGAHLSSLCASGRAGYMGPPNIAKSLVDLSFRVYESLKIEPLAFYQLEEDWTIDFAYDRLRATYTLLNDFVSRPFDAATTSNKCEALINLYKDSLSAIDAIFNAYPEILQNLDEGRFISRWNALKRIYELEFGPILRTPIV
jgi:hypothetical protein